MLPRTSYFTRMSLFQCRNETVGTISKLIGKKPTLTRPRRLAEELFRFHIALILMMANCIRVYRREDVPLKVGR